VLSTRSAAIENSSPEHRSPPILLWQSLPSNLGVQNSSTQESAHRPSPLPSLAPFPTPQIQSARPAAVFPPWFPSKNARTTITRVAPRGHIDGPEIRLFFCLPLRISPPAAFEMLLHAARALFPDLGFLKSLRQSRRNRSFSCNKVRTSNSSPTRAFPANSTNPRHPLLIFFCQFFAIKKTFDNPGRRSERSREDSDRAAKFHIRPQSGKRRDCFSNITWCCMVIFFEKNTKKPPEQKT